jgi:hypothetical protein
MNMKTRTTLFFVLGLILFSLDACGLSSNSTTVTGAATTVATGSNDVNQTANTPSGASNSAASDAPASLSVVEAIAGMSVAHEATDVPPSDSAATTKISLQDDSILVEGDGVMVNNRNATITAAGTYILSGTLTDGQIIVDTADETTVYLILNGVTLSHARSAPIYIAKAQETVITLADGSNNSVSDGETYLFATPDEDEPNAAIFSKGDLAISGTGSLTVNGRYNDGIASKDGLIITGGQITVNAIDDGIRGKDYLVINDGLITINAQGDGLKADNDEDATKGYIAISGGVLDITADGDAIQAQTDVMVSAGIVQLTAGGGSRSQIGDDLSAKGLKAAVDIIIDGGIFTINAADDAIHANNNIIVNGGDYTLATGDDGLHADATLTINDGDIRITESYEGIESAVITINDGNIHIVASDDGLNVAGGNDSSGFARGPGLGGGPGRGAVPGQEAFTYTGDYYLYINGGYIVVEAEGDGIDVNGAIEMRDGVVIVHGPTQQMNGALDYDATFKLTGGLLVAVGSAGMVQAPDASSTQSVLLLNLNGALSVNELIHIQSSDGQEVLTFAPIKAMQSITFSSPLLEYGTTYNVYYGGSTSGVAQDGLYENGTYTPGTQYTSFTIASVVTAVGNRAR